VDGKCLSCLAAWAAKTWRQCRLTFSPVARVEMEEEAQVDRKDQWRLSCRRACSTCLASCPLTRRAICPLEQCLSVSCPHRSCPMLRCTLARCRCQDRLLAQWVQAKAKLKANGRNRSSKDRRSALPEVDPLVSRRAEKGGHSHRSNNNHLFRNSKCFLKGPCPKSHLSVTLIGELCESSCLMEKRAQKPVKDRRVAVPMLGADRPPWLIWEMEVLATSSVGSPLARSLGDSLNGNSQLQERRQKIPSDASLARPTVQNLQLVATRHLAVLLRQRGPGPLQVAPLAALVLRQRGKNRQRGERRQSDGLPLSGGHRASHWGEIDQSGPRKR